MEYLKRHIDSLREFRILKNHEAFEIKNGNNAQKFKFEKGS